MAIQKHLVVIPQEDGSVIVQPLKEWLRQNPAVLPGVDPTSATSWQLRNMLKSRGWTMQETPTEVRLIAPDSIASSQEVSEILGDADKNVQNEEDSFPYFSLEYQLRDFIASNLDTITIEGRNLRLYVDQAGRDGVEFPTAVGPIDILATDDAGAIYVFELKRANSSDRAVGQFARYMGWVRQTIGRDQEVFGIVVAKTISANLRYAASVVPNISLYEYDISFRLNQANNLPKPAR